MISSDTQTIRRLGVCPITGERCTITAVYRPVYRLHDPRHVRESASCSLGQCDRQDECGVYSHFPAEYLL